MELFSFIGALREDNKELVREILASSSSINLNFRHHGNLHLLGWVQSGEMLKYLVEQGLKVNPQTVNDFDFAPDMEFFDKALSIGFLSLVKSYFELGLLWPKDEPWCLIQICHSLAYTDSLNKKQSAKLNDIVKEALTYMVKRKAMEIPLIWDAVSNYACSFIFYYLFSSNLIDLEGAIESINILMRALESLPEKEYAVSKDFDRAKLTKKIIEHRSLRLLKFLLFKKIITAGNILTAIDQTKGLTPEEAIEYHIANNRRDYENELLMSEHNREKRELLFENAKKLLQESDNNFDTAITHYLEIVRILNNNDSVKNQYTLPIELASEVALYAFAANPSLTRLEQELLK